MRRSAPLLAVVAAAVLGLIILSPWAWAAEPTSPTVTFTATGVVPLSCGSRPDVSSLTVPEGTTFIVANDIGTGAWLRVGAEPVLELPSGSGVLLALSAGQHEVRLAPNCVITNLDRAQAVTVTVTAAAPESPSPSASPPAAPASAPPPSAPPASGQPQSPDQPQSSGQPSGAPSTPPGSGIDIPAGATVTPTQGLGGTATASNGSPGLVASPPADGGTMALGRPAVITATEVDLGGRNPKDVRLLAIIATICVLGVTAAVIRSIVRLSP